jgi:DNA helicase II / ATP-dependent DNA helicase PcrA
VNEFRILGPPGTGKTTYLAKQIENASEKHGSENVIVASYTRTAANVLNRRNLPIPRENIGTLHSLCYRGMKDYEIAEVNAAKFNEACPEAAITVSGEGRMDEMVADAVYKTDGDKHLAEYNMCRAKLQSLDKLSKPTLHWIKKWESWKHDNHYIDFTDMIEMTIDHKEPYPGNPRIGIYDEVQDFNALEMTLVRHWAQFQDYIILAGDDDQCIFDFCGSSPEAFLNPPVDDAHKRILNQSWRLPRKIHEYSQRWIKQIKKREPKEFLPKNIDGEIFSSIATYKTPHKALDLAEKYISKGKTVMMLTSCGYLLEPLKKLLKSSGIPFHNPYRPSRGDWNPMGSFFHRRTGTVSTMERLLAFLNTDSYYWSGKDLSLWLELVRHKGVLTRYAKDRLQDMMDLNKGYIHMEEEFYEDIFDPFALERALNRDLVWFRDVLLASKRNAVEYPLAVFSKKGKAVLEEKPKLCIGTIHSVKGGEADVVILFPDLSLAAYQDYKMNPDSTIRTFYVGMTRARETLILCTPQSDLSMKLH